MHIKNDQLRKEVDKYKDDNNIMKEIIKNMQIERDSLTKQLEELKEIQNNQKSSEVQKENIALKQSVSTLEKDLTKFVSATKTFDKILESQKSAYDKTRIGYSQNNNLYKNFYVTQKEKYKCSFCHKDGHLEPFCFKKRKLKSFKTSEHSQNNLKQKNYNKYNHFQKKLGINDQSNFSYKKPSYYNRRMAYKPSFTNIQ
jgi:cell division protein FtsB